VMFDRDGAPETGITTCLTPHGDRAWATTTDPDLLETMTSDDLAGSAVAIAAGRLEL
jgi:acetyl-CoA C-acetyltransferase